LLSNGSNYKNKTETAIIQKAIEVSFEEEILDIGSEEYETVRKLKIMNKINDHSIVS
jgi:hypothetical protein